MEGNAVGKSGRMLGTLLLLAFVGCASELSIGTAYDPLAVFPREGTYAWAEGSNVISEEIAHLGLADLLPQAVEGALADRGWRKAAPASADLLVSYQVGVTIIVQVATPDSDERSQATGSLSVALVDPKEKRRLWVGFIEAEVNPSLSREERRNRLEKALERLFEEFPP
jgi:hypothetical protein